MLVRNRERGEDARARIAERTGSDRLVLELCDVSSLASVREFAERFTAEQPELHALINNAGTMPPERTHTDEGFELTFATNVARPVSADQPAARLTRARRAVAGRQRLLRRHVHAEACDVEDLQLERREYDPPAFYAHTKRCEVILTELWAERLRGTGVSVHSMHPGWADTPGVQTSLPRFRKLMRPLLRDAGQGADTVVWLATAPEPGEPLRPLLARPRAAAGAPGAVDARERRTSASASGPNARGSAAGRTTRDPAAVGEARA